MAAAYSWQFAWTPGVGYLANLLPASAAPLTNQIQAIGIIILAEIWKTAPFMTLLLLAGVPLFLTNCSGRPRSTGPAPGSGSPRSCSR